MEKRLVNFLSMPPKNTTMVKPTKNVSKSTSKVPKSASKKDNDPYALVIEMAEDVYQNGGTLTYDDVLKFGEE